jgi:hypothetical protein
LTMWIYNFACCRSQHLLRAARPKDKMIDYADLQLCLLPKPTPIKGCTMRWVVMETNLSMVVHQPLHLDS